MKEIRGWEEIIIETKDGELIVDITAENYIAKDGYNIRLVPCEDEKTTIDVAEVVRCKDCIHRYVTGIEALKEPDMIPIKLEKRYPESRDEDITDAFMQGYLKGIEISTIKAKAIEALSAEAEWIPCSERLPEKSEWYIVTVNVEDESVVYLRWYSELHGWEWDEQNNTIAWMPLPKPYREESGV